MGGGRGTGPLLPPRGTMTLKTHRPRGGNGDGSGNGDASNQSQCTDESEPEKGISPITEPEKGISPITGPDEPTRYCQVLGGRKGISPISIVTPADDWLQEATELVVVNLSASPANYYFVDATKSLGAGKGDKSNYWTRRAYVIGLIPWYVAGVRKRCQEPFIGKPGRRNVEKGS